LKLDEEQINPGDFVLLEHLSDGSCRIEGLLPRSTKLSRRAVAGSREQVIVANVDQLAAVFSAGEPAPDFRLLDRFLVLAELNELSAFIVLNKTDLPSDAGTLDAFDIYREAGYHILPTSAHRGDGISELSRRLGGHATVFAGPSGVGKSSLLNLLLPEHELKVREVSRKRGRGLPASGRGIRRGHAGAAATGALGSVARRASGSVSRVQLGDRQLPLQRLPARDRAGLRRATAHRGRGSERSALRQLPSPAG
jgi:hypothetical protein